MECIRGSDTVVDRPPHESCAHGRMEELEFDVFAWTRDVWHGVRRGQHVTSAGAAARHRIPPWKLLELRMVAARGSDSVLVDYARHLLTETELPAKERCDTIIRREERATVRDRIFRGSSDQSACGKKNGEAGTAGCATELTMRGRFTYSFRARAARMVA
jgi:hypothetical protein